MQTLELKPEMLPLKVLLRVPNGIKEYVLIRTKQDKLLLNRRIEVPVNQDR